MTGGTEPGSCHRRTKVIGCPIDLWQGQVMPRLPGALRHQARRLSQCGASAQPTFHMRRSSGSTVSRYRPHLCLPTVGF
jgi:hypothetical protein